MLAVVGAVSSPWLVSLFGANEAVAQQANEYLVISMWGLPAMLIVFAATGLLRGHAGHDDAALDRGARLRRERLLNWLFIYGLGWGIAGSAAGTVTAQWGMVAAYALVIRRLATRHSASLRAQGAGIRSTATSGGWLFLRTVSLRVALLATVGIATGIGTEELAGWQIVFTIFSAAAFALDALAIAAQALIGKELGAETSGRSTGYWPAPWPGARGSV